MPRGRAPVARLVLLAVAALGYWWGVARLGGVREPWDAAAFWTVAYPLSLLLAAVAGWWLRRGVAAGAVVALAQAPLAFGGGGTLWVAGLLMLALLALPSIAAGAAGAWAARRWRRGR